MDGPAGAVIILTHLIKGEARIQVEFWSHSQLHELIVFSLSEILRVDPI